MLGAIIGDIVGSPYEFNFNNIKTKDFPLFSKRSYVTDDSIMTLAVAKGVMEGYKDSSKTEEAVIQYMQEIGRHYPKAGYGANFLHWMYDEEPQPYQSFGNGSAMRVASVAWIYNELDTVLHFAEITAKVTHNHPEGIKGAQATAAAIFLARQGFTKEEIKQYIEETFYYDLSRTCDEIRPTYYHVESCQETVPEAITAFLEGEDFEDVLRLAVSLGGDSDTLTCIAASIAEAYYPIPEEIANEALSLLDDRCLTLWDEYIEFLKALREKRTSLYENLKTTISFFEKRERTTWFTPPTQGDTHFFGHPEYGQEVRILEDFAQTSDFRVKDYGRTLERFGLRMDLDLFLEKAPSSNTYILRAMLTSIVRQERFNDGLIAAAIEKGVIVTILHSLKNKLTDRMM